MLLRYAKNSLTYVSSFNRNRRTIIPYGKFIYFYTEPTTSTIEHLRRESCNSSIDAGRMSIISPEASTFLGKAFVQLNKENNSIRISFEIIHKDKTKQFNLLRKPDESLLVTIQRIKLNIDKISKRTIKNNKKKANVSGTSPIDDESDYYGGEEAVKLTYEGKTIDPASTKNIDAWIDGAHLNIYGKSYEITTNNPMVESIQIPSNIMQDYTCIPRLNLINCFHHTCKFEWFRKITRVEYDQLVEAQKIDKNDVVLESAAYWLKISDKLIYSPNQDDLAHHLKVVCLPSDGVKVGPKAEHISKGPVEIGPRDCPFEKRQQLTKDLLTDPNQFRVVSYNILADLYADQDYSRSYLFAHCPEFALDIDYRRQLLVKEMIGYNSDIYCLQEVDKKEFEKNYEFSFKFLAGCSGVFSRKGGQVAEGTATFFRDDKFELVHSHRTILSHLIDIKTEPTTTESPKEKIQLATAGDLERQQSQPDASENPEEQQAKAPDNIEPHFILEPRDSDIAKACLANFASIKEAISSNPKLKERFLNRHTMLQTSLLKLKNFVNKYILVANTHLYFAPDADHVRLLQASCCLKYLEFIKDYYYSKLRKEYENQPSIGIIFCGDMNSTPDCGLYKLAQEGHIGKNLPDWSSNKEEAVIDLEVSTSLRFSPAYKDIEYTNYTPLFNGCLDYIYYEVDKLDCRTIVPMPDHKDVTNTGGIPSQVFPSDHLALIADLEVVK